MLLLVLLSLIGSADGEIAEHALGLLRNVVCTYDEDAEPAFGMVGVGEERLLSLITGRLVHDEDQGMIENVSRGARLQMTRVRGDAWADLSPAAGVVYSQGLITLTNLATEGESSRLAMATRDDVLLAVIRQLVSLAPSLARPAQNPDPADTVVSLSPDQTHPAPRVRACAVALFTQLGAAGPDLGPGRWRAHKEVREKLRVLGVTERVRGMGVDGELDVRERVRDYLERVEGEGVGGGEWGWEA